MKRLTFALLALVEFATSCGDPSFVEKVTIANSYEYDVLAEVSGDGVSWLNLGGVDRESEETTQHVIDMGEQWIFRFRYPYEDVEPGEVSLTRSELQAAGWRVEVPAALAERLRKRGEPPSISRG